MVFFFFTSPLCHHHPPRVSILSPLISSSSNSRSVLLVFFFPPLFFHFFFFSFPPPPFFSLLFLSFFQNERLRACTGTERPARWASALIGDATRTVEQSQGEEVGAEFFRKVFPIVDFRTSSLSLSLCVCVVGPACTRYDREGRGNRARTRPQKYGAAGNADWYF